MRLFKLLFFQFLLMMLNNIVMFVDPPGGGQEPPAGDPPAGDPPSEEFEVYNGFKVPKGAVDAINKRVATEVHTWKEKFKSTSDQLNSLSVQMEEMKLSTMSEKDRQAHDEKKRQEAMEALEKKANDKDSKFKNYFLETELFKEVSNYDVINAKQVIALIKSEYKQEFAEEGESVNIFFNNGSSKLTVQEAVKTFLNDPTNANLIKSSLIPGAGTKPRGMQSKNLRTTFKRSEVAVTSSEAAAEYRAAMKTGLNPVLTD